MKNKLCAAHTINVILLLTAAAILLHTMIIPGRQTSYSYGYIMMSYNTNAWQGAAIMTLVVRRSIHVELPFIASNATTKSLAKRTLKACLDWTSKCIV